MKKILSITVAVMAMAVSSWGTPVLGWVETWDAGLGTGGNWDYAVLGDGAPYSLANSGQTLQLTMPDTTVPYASMFANATSSGGKFSGDYYSIATALLAASSNLIVQFDLQTINNYNNNDGAMVLYFLGNGNEYVYAGSLTQPSPGVLTAYELAIGSSAVWNNLNNGTFSADFANVTEFGFKFVGSSDTAAHPIQLDNLTLIQGYMVPEPETIWMLLAVVLSLAVTFRTRLSQVIRS